MTAREVALAALRTAPPAWAALAATAWTVSPVGPARPEALTEPQRALVVVTAVVVCWTLYQFDREIRIQRRRYT